MHPDVASSLDNLAVLYNDMGRFSDALPLYERAYTFEYLVWGQGTLQWLTV